MNRRAVFGAIAAGAMLAAPRAAKSESLDAELIALAPAIEAADRALDAAIDVVTLAEGNAKPLIPEKPANPPMDAASREAIEAFGKRMAEIRPRGPSVEEADHEAALLKWEADTARVRAECGVDDAEAAEGEALDVVMELQARVAETPARTLASLIFKARYAAERDNDPDVMASIVADLLALDGEA
jgi:hypothetical protein